jgi:organic radical activating enzyme
MKELNVGINMKIVSCSSPDNILRINWHILNWCNYKCSYCSVRGNLSYDYNDTTQISNQYKLMISRLKLIKKPFELCLTGGEPTLHPNIKEILKGLGEIEKLERVYFFTNLSRSINFYEEILNFKKILYYASYHPEYHDEDFLIKCKKLRCEVHISMMSEYKNKILKFIEECKSEKIPFCLNFLSDTKFYKNTLDHDFYEEVIKTDDMIEIDLIYENKIKQKTTNLKMLYEGKNKFKGYKCIPESYSITIDNVVKNVCSNKEMPLSLSNITEKITCSYDECKGGLMMYPKELI